MERKKLITWYVIGVTVIVAALALRLLRMGQPPSQILISIGIVLIFLLIPILGANRSLKRKEIDPSLGLKELIIGRRFAMRVIIRFIVCPLLGGLIYYLMYPSTLALPLAMIVLIAGNLFVVLLTR